METTPQAAATPAAPSPGSLSVSEPAMPAAPEASTPRIQAPAILLPEAVEPTGVADGRPDESEPAAIAEPQVPQTPSEPVTPLARGLASWYGPRFHGRRTASGERYNMHELTAAHKSLPFGTRLRVRSVHTGKEVVVRVNDRGPYKHQRIIDLSRAAMVALGTLERGVTEVELLRE